MSAYIRNESVEIFGRIPRFGHSTDFSVLFANSRSDKTDYSVGAIFVGAILFSFFTLWMLLLAIFMCSGPRRVGFLAGFRMKQPWGKKKFWTPAIVRSIFIISSVLVIATAAVSIFVWGFNDLETASTEGLELAEKFTSIAQTGDAIVASMIKPIGEYAALRDIVINELRSEVFCSGNPGQAINETRNDVVQSLYSLEDFSAGNLSTLRTEIFGNMESIGESGEYYFGIFGVKEWQVWTYLVSFCAIPFFFIIGTILAAAGKPFKTLACFNTWFLLPIFLVLVTLAWTVVSFYGVGAVMNSDYCSGGDATGNPDITTQNIFDVSKGGIEKEVYSYWLTNNNDDSATFPLSFLSALVSKLATSVRSIALLVSEMEDATDLSTTCGGKDFVPILDYMKILTSNYLELSANMTQVQASLSFENIHPIYVDLVYGVTCTDMPEAGVWAFGSLLIIAFFGMVIITCRTAWLVTIEQNGLSSFTIEEPALGDEKQQPTRSGSFDEPPGRRYDSAEKEDDDDDDDNSIQNLEEVSIASGHELDDVIDDDGFIKRNSLAQDESHKFVPVATKKPSWAEGVKGGEEDVAKDDWENGGRFFRRGKPTKKYQDFPVKDDAGSKNKEEDAEDWW